MELQLNNLKVDGGEGSRGGRIIGHTTSGKPIYANHKHTAHREFTHQEHEQAFLKHGEERKKAEGKWKSSKSKKEKMAGFDEMESHDRAMTFHGNKARKKGSGAFEVSGGMISHKRKKVHAESTASAQGRITTTG